MKRSLLAFAMFWCCSVIFSQEYFPTNNSVKKQNNNYTAFTNAKIYVTPSQIIENGVLLIQNEKVISVGQSVKIPENTLIINLKGKHIYPSFIDIYSGFGIKKPKRKTQTTPQYDASRSGYYWNDHIMPENKALEKFVFDTKKAKELTNIGFGIVNTHVQDGIIRGTSSLIALNQKADNSIRIIDSEVAQHLSFKKSLNSNQYYPSSLMGAIVLIKQFYHDSKWYENGNSNTKDLSIEAFIKNKQLPQIFEADGKLNDIRVAKIANEFNINYIIKGGGNEFERIQEVASTNAKFIIPINFPKPYDVSDPYAASKLSLADMRFWNQAPSNLKALSDKNISFAITLDGLKKVTDFKPNLLQAIDYGFDKTKALEALTTTPASLLNKSDLIGSLKTGRYANFLITSGEIFEKKTILYENWVQGKKHIVKNMDIKDIRGNYDLTVGQKKYALKISGELEKLKAEIKLDTVKISSKITYKDEWINIFYIPKSDNSKQFTRLAGKITSIDNFSGKGVFTNGSDISWKAVKKEKDSVNAKKEKKKEDETPLLLPITYPNKAYGFSSMPAQQTVLFKNATVWTSEAEGVLKDTDVLVKNGKIVEIGKNISNNNAMVIDATNKHLTAGIVDEHSHIATEAINEVGHNSSAEVTIEDVVDSEDVNIYRNLSGGVTTIQILHGSANPIGGRSAIIKLKWGKAPDELLMKDSPKFIKFALGENVKQTNWGENQTIRFPQTRMGVEQLYIDYFQRAKEYDTKWKTYNKLSSKEKAKKGAPRYDIEMETLAEIINKERFVTCHSYIQSEINMLMKVAEKFNFNINTFTHILEGYKVADKMKEHGVGGSTFSDWWAYKYEVNDAIPYNAAIMHSQGVTVAINSDDPEMSRRLNQEAAKSIKYGNISEEDAWKFVTINPAKLLHLDHKIGSIKTGKDADLVLWSDHPLSIYAIAEKTMIEGVFYYDYEKMNEMETQIKEEKNKLINMMIQKKNKGMETQTPKKKASKNYHCNSLEYQNL